MTVPRVASLLVLLLALPFPATAQRDRFFGTLPALYRSLAGVYGDEGADISAHIDTLSQALAAWDREVAAAELALRKKLVGTDDRTALDVHVDLLLLYAERGRLGDALRAVDDALRIDPNSPGRLRYKALLHQAADGPVDAADAFRAAWLIDAPDPQNAYWLVVQRSPRTTDAEVEQALATLRGVERELIRGRQRSLDPPIPVVLPINDDVGRATPFAPAGYARPFALLLSGEFGEGIAALETAAAADPLMADPALRLDPTSKGIALLREGRVPEAISLLDAAVSRAPDSSEARRILGTAHLVNGDTMKGIEQLRVAVKLNPANERAWLALARTLETVDEAEEASHVLGDAIAALPDSGALRWLLYTLSPMLQRSDATNAELIAVADRLVLLAGKGEMYARVAELAKSHLDYQRAISLLERRVALTPNNPAAHSALGRAYVEDGRESAGYAELVMSLLLDPDGTDALTTLGRLHLSAGRYTEAVEALERAAALNSSDGEILRALGDALVHAGRTAEGHARAQEAARAQAAAVEEQRRRRTFGMLGSQAALSMQMGEYERAIELWRRVIRMERNLLIQRLQRAGIQIIEWDVSQPFDQAVRSALIRPHVVALGRHL
jgi:tetratricopeptide (TPR) repeat protein